MARRRAWFNIVYSIKRHSRAGGNLALSRDMGSRLRRNDGGQLDRELPTAVNQQSVRKERALLKLRNYSLNKFLVPGCGFFIFKPVELNRFDNVLRDRIIFIQKYILQ